MADSPFSVSPPSWLERIARPIDAERTGEIIGTGLAGALNAFQKNTQADEDAGLGKAGDSKGFREGLMEARLNQADPLWKQKFQVSKQARWMQVQESGARLSVLDQTLKAKQQASRDEADDQLAYASAKSEVGNDALKLVNHTMPAFKSPKYRMMWQTDVNTAKNADAVVERNASMSALKTQNAKDESEFAKSLSSLSGEEGIRDRQAIQKEKDPIKRIDMMADAQARQQARLEAQRKAAGLVETGERGGRATYGVPKGDTLYAEKPIVENIGGQTFARWGKQWRKIPNKAEEGQVRVLVDRVVKLQDALIKSPESSTPTDSNWSGADNSLTKQLLDARKKLNLKESEESDKLSPSAPASAATPSKRLTYDPTTDTLK